MIDAAISHDSDIGSATADIGNQDAGLFLFFSQDSFSAGQRFENQVFDFDTDAAERTGSSSGLRRRRR